MPLELARHLVWGAVDHARSLDLEPAPDFTAAAGHLGGWAETSDITFGRHATPCYVAGPYDNPQAIIRILDRVCGQGNYEYLVPAG